MEETVLVNSAAWLTHVLEVETTMDALAEVWADSEWVELSGQWL
jgi:hypothetical protein